LNIRIKKQHLN